jgi:type IV secretory pathway VirB2 component (pilin)
MTNLARNTNLTSRTLFAAAVALTVCFISTHAYAASTGMPWEGPLNQLLASLTGPVAKAIGVAAIVLCALGLAAIESGHFMKKVIAIVFGLSVAYNATMIAVTWFGASGGIQL